MAHRIQLCGRLTVTLAGTRLDDQLPGPQGRLLLAYLVVNRLRPATRTELVDVLWPSRPPTAADSSISSLLSKLRRVLPIEGGSAPQVILPADIFVDVDAAGEAIHRAESAVRRRDYGAAWGPARVALHTTTRTFLPGEDGAWATEIRAGLDRIRLRALECVGEVGLGLEGAEIDAALRAGATLVRAAPLRESGYRLLMRALAADGNRAEALAVYDGLRQMLRDELGAPPSEATQELYRALLR